MSFRVWHFDGLTARRRFPALIADEHGFMLEDEQGRDGPIPWDSLIAREAQGGDAVFGLKGRTGWRLGLGGEVPPEVLLRLPKPERYGRWVDRHGLGRTAAVFAVFAAAALFVLLSAPRWIAPYVPASWEARLGDAIVGDFGGRICNGPGGQPALDALARKLDPGGEGSVEVRVANISMVNAVALPGGKIVIFRGLLQEAVSADEVAGVLGHEIGHVRNRDVLAALLRQAGLSVLLGGLGGDVSGAFNAILSATYSREAEAAADRFSIAALRRAGISGKDTAAFFRRAGDLEKKLGRTRAALSYLSSHPMSDARERLFEQAVPRNAKTVPSLTREQWDALADICHNDRTVKKEGDWWGF